MERQADRVSPASYSSPPPSVVSVASATASAGASAAASVFSSAGASVPAPAEPEPTYDAAMILPFFTFLTRTDNIIAGLSTNADPVVVTFHLDRDALRLVGDHRIVIPDVFDRLAIASLPLVHDRDAVERAVYVRNTILFKQILIA